MKHAQRQQTEIECIFCLGGRVLKSRESMDESSGARKEIVAVIWIAKQKKSIQTFEQQIALFFSSFQSSEN